VNAATNQVKKRSLVERIADAVLYEGYILYPYRPSAVKNQQRWNFGVVSPESYAVAQPETERSTMQTECLIECDSSTTVTVKVRFLHLLLREVAEVVVDCGLPATECGHLVDETNRHFQIVPSLKLNGEILQTWQEAVEREVVIPEVKIGELDSPHCVEFTFPASKTTELQTEDASGAVAGLLIRTQHAIEGQVEISVSRSNRQSATGNRQLLNLSIAIRNLAECAGSRDDALMHSFVSTHTILETQGGAFVSLLDPPASYKAAVAECINTGTYPVLVGEAGERDCMLSSPIILYDYPQIAPESPGDLFDGTEIDEILTLRIMSLTEDEKREMRSADELARKILERTESMSAEQLLNLHGVMRKSETVK
jgi:hydrogenase maturation protease